MWTKGKAAREMMQSPHRFAIKLINSEMLGVGGYFRNQ